MTEDGDQVSDHTIEVMLEECDPRTVLGRLLKEVIVARRTKKAMLDWADQLENLGGTGVFIAFEIRTRLNRAEET